MTLWQRMMSGTTKVDRSNLERTLDFRQLLLRPEFPINKAERPETLLP